MKENFLLNQETEDKLLAKIMLRLDREAKLRVLRYRLFLALIFLVSLLAAVGPIWRNFYLDWQQAGLLDYLSLLIFDARIVLGNWQNFCLGFLESLPVISTVAALTVLLICLIVIKVIFKCGREFLIISHGLVHKTKAENI